MKWLLAPAACLFGAGVKVRNGLYNRKWLPSYTAPLPVVSVGNIAVGGRGKTPFTLKLAEALSQQGHRVALLSRGYRSSAEKGREPTVVSRGGGPLVGPKVCGDEVFLLASRLPEAYVIAGRDRLRGVTLAAELGADLALLDDGMQHRRLARDVEIVLVSRDEEGHFFPWGALRDDPQRLAQADFVFEVAHVPKEVVMQTGERGISLKGRRVGVFCAIAAPERFIKTIEEMGARPVAAHFARDHSMLGARTLEKLACEAKRQGAELLVCTEKDAVKGFPKQEWAIPICWVKSDAEIVRGSEDWERLMGRINDLIRIKR